MRTAIRLIKKEKGNDSPEWDYLRIRLVEDAPMALSEIKPHMLNSPTCFEAVVLGIEPRTMYIKVGWYECPKGHKGKEVKCDKYKKLTAQKCTEPVSGGNACGEKMYLVQEKSIQDFIQRIVIQEPIENTKFGIQKEYDAKIPEE